ncbi:type I DNA topoisomerase [Zhouia spongiae]|uniref:DNA topoisomerase 1 n=1 Tax=Zhouia spongiae TaxID=2202721 RepID=A0ABY3YQU2_9FLAO|nr:type I DNA topoisomerase [Zhouia spongiae]UNZ00187.1 type I DNA topoisomerase [Zhouia spongiae]
MAKNLVIVESPAKAKTIEKFLGKDFKVTSSFGHIADLPSRELGVDVEKDFKPKYVVDKEKKALVKKLKEMAKSSDTVWLASDEDREGEAIAWHLAETLKLDKDKTKRIVFNSITKSAILKAIENPRTIDYNLVNAQQARRVLDRLVGYEISPILWKKIKTGLSAGRVQSVAVRLIVEREREIQGFVPEASYRVAAEFVTKEGKVFKAKLQNTFNSKEAAGKFLQKNIAADFSVSDLDTRPAKKSPAAPFTTSTLQQEASRKLYFSVSKTMRMAQRLYEAGLITYMRTDSTNLSSEAVKAAKEEIVRSYGEKYSKPRNYATKAKGAQEAHEAIRPTNMAVHDLKDVERDMARLYELIWKRTIASQMSEAQLERTNVKIQANKHDELFLASGEVLKFDGFLKVYLEGTDDEDEEQEGMLPALTVGEYVDKKYMSATQRYTRPPYRYTEASLVKKLEELGIGRPSTYAPTISTIQTRGYVERGMVEGVERKYVQLMLLQDSVKEEVYAEKVGSDKGKLVPTDIGMIVNDFLVNHFSSILDYNFTAKVEEDFDNIASGGEDWTKMMKDFYEDFHPNVKNVEEHAERETGERVLGEDPESGRQVSVRLGKFGPMAQIGTSEEEEKPRFASLLPDQSIETLTLEEALSLFELPRVLGVYEGEEVAVNVGRFGPYVRFGKSFVSLGKDDEVFDVTMDRAIELIKEKQKADAPIASYQGKEVTKGKGRFGPFIKWDGKFINVNKKYDFDNLSDEDIVALIEDKIKKDAEKLISYWEEEDIKLEKGRWGTSTITKGKKKINLPKTVDATKLTLEQVKEIIEKETKTKKKTTKKTTKSKK